MIFSREKTFIGQVKSLNKGDSADSQLIWRSLEGPKSQENISYFCLQLFEHVLHSQKKSFLLANEQRLYATLLIIELFKNKKSKNPKLLEECGKFIQKMEASLGKSLLLFLFSNERQERYGCFFLSRLFMAPVSIDPSESISAIFSRELTQTEQYFRSRYKQSWSTRNHENLKYQSYPTWRLPQSKILTFGYLCFINHINRNNHTVTVQEYQHIVQVLKYLVCAAEKEITAEELLPSMIHLIMACVTFYGCDSSILKVFMGAAERLRYFGGVVGKMGAIMLEMMYDQLRVPGTAFRRKLKKDFPSLALRQNTFINKQFFMITDQQQHIYDRPQDQSLITLRKLIILNILKSTEGISPEEMGEYVQFLKKLGQQPIYTILDKLEKIIDVVAKSESVGVIRELQLEYVRKFMGEAMTKNWEGGEFDQTDQFCDFMHKTNEKGYFPYPKLELISVAVSDFTSNKQNVYNLSAIIKKHKTDFQTSGFFKNKICIAFNGNGYSFVRLSNTIAKYLQTTQIEHSKQILIYYIPRNDFICRQGIGRYMSYHDSWYRRFVYNIHHDKILYPHLQLTSEHKELLPFYLFSKNIQMYLREANYSLAIRVYRCRLKMIGQETEEVVYMANYVSMGLFCQARLIKMQKEREKNKEEKEYVKDLTEIVHEKLKKFPPFHIELEAQVYDNLTETTTTIKQTDLYVEDLQICNLPCEYFMGRQPRPSSALLQMTILTPQNAKIFKKQIENNDNFKQNKQFEHAQQAFKDLFISRTVKSVTIENLDTATDLRVIVDGNAANKIQKMRLEPCISVSGVPVSLQLQCFVPTV